jgi:hypothetical protein
MGRSNAKSYGERNSTEGAVLVRIRPTKVIAQRDTAEWEECNGDDDYRPFEIITLHWTQS